MGVRLVLSILWIIHLTCAIGVAWRSSLQVSDLHIDPLLHLQLVEVHMWQILLRQLLGSGPQLFRAAQVEL